MTPKWGLEGRVCERARRLVTLLAIWLYIYVVTRPASWAPSIPTSSGPGHVLVVTLTCQFLNEMSDDFFYFFSSWIWWRFCTREPHHVDRWVEVRANVFSASAPSPSPSYWPSTKTWFDHGLIFIGAAAFLDLFLWDHRDSPPPWIVIMRLKLQLGATWCASQLALVKSFTAPANCSSPITENNRSGTTNCDEKHPLFPIGDSCFDSVCFSCTPWCVSLQWNTRF